MKTVYTQDMILEGQRRVRENFVHHVTNEDALRHAARCAKCKKRWMTKAHTETLHWRARIVNLDGTIYREPWHYDTTKVLLAQPTCPHCGARPAQAKAIKGTYNPKVRCDVRCINAVSEECSCACGGLNHGAAHDPGYTLLEASK